MNRLSCKSHRIVTASPHTWGQQEGMLMRTDVERLRRDHAMFRRKLDALDTAAAWLPGTGLVVRDLCVALAKQLPHHIQREARAYHVAHANNGVGPSPEELAT